MSTDNLPERFHTTLIGDRVVAILRNRSAAEAILAGQRLVEQGVRIIEVSLNTPGAVDAIATLTAEFGNSLFVGAGTVLNRDDVFRVADAGATFYVAPVLDRDAIAASSERGLLAIPGCATPTEMREAYELGAFAVKVFPATLWTPEGLANVLRAMPFLRAIPTGGVNVSDTGEWLAAGSIALGIASAFTKPGAVAQFKEQVRAFAATEEAS